MPNLAKYRLTAVCAILIAWPTTALAQGEVNSLLGEGLPKEDAAASAMVVFVARKVITMEPANPEATAVAVMAVDSP